MKNFTLGTLSVLLLSSPQAHAKSAIETRGRIAYSDSGEIFTMTTDEAPSAYSLKVEIQNKSVEISSDQVYPGVDSEKLADALQSMFEKGLTPTENAHLIGPMASQIQKIQGEKITEEMVAKNLAQYISTQSA